MTPDNLPTTLPLLSLDFVVFPAQEADLTFRNPTAIATIRAILKSGAKYVALVRRQSKIGTLLLIRKIRPTSFPDKSARMITLFVEGIQRLEIVSLIQESPYPLVEVGYLPDKPCSLQDRSVLARFELAQIIFDDLVDSLPHIPLPAKLMVKETLRKEAAKQDVGLLANFIISVIPKSVLSTEKRQEILEQIDPVQRLDSIVELIFEILYQSQAVSGSIEEQKKAYTEHLVRKEMEILQKLLPGRSSDTDKYRSKIRELPLPPEVQNRALEEVDRLASLSKEASEHSYISTWLDWLISLPWGKETKDRLDIKEAERILEEDHHGLTEIKKRVLEFLAVRALGGGKKSPILCFVGPPGTGKTSVGQSIARAMDRKFVRVSLGGIYDEAQIRGFKRTYVGALPGIIIAKLKEAGSCNPVFMIDEVDKIGRESLHGDPSSALLEALDPEQNSAFVDHYLDVPFDLSKVLFICTGNWLEPVQPALRDRMEVVEFSSYTTEEKLAIAKRYLVPRQISANGLKPEQIQIDDSALLSIIKDYTKEAGVRNLEKQINRICRYVATRIVKKETEKEIITRDRLLQILGPKVYLSQVKERISRPGVATGLAFTEMGGEIIFVEVEKIPSPDKESELVITGHIENIMAESAKTALTYVEANLEMLGIASKRSPVGHKIHIHVPEAAVPKDGPSAGITIFVALVSLLRKQPVRDDLAMTGEITLRGKVLAVGGIKEKVLAAIEAGIKTIILPEANKGDFEGLPENVKETIRKESVEIKFVAEMKDVLAIALAPTSS